MSAPAAIQSYLARGAGAQSSGGYRNRNENVHLKSPALCLCEPSGTAAAFGVIMSAAGKLWAAGKLSGALAAATIPRATTSIPKTLVLNADYSPISLTNAARSIMLIRRGVAMALEDSGLKLNSENETFEAPAVIVLSSYVKVKYNAKKILNQSASRGEIMRRDDYTCQYCGSVATTLDHVHPVSKGGTSRWDNLVAACVPCNTKKGNMLLGDPRLQMTLRGCVPSRPTPMEALTMTHVSYAPPSVKTYRSTWRKYLMPDA